jgi:hypothetical protein
MSVQSAATKAMRDCTARRASAVGI